MKRAYEYFANKHIKNEVIDRKQFVSNDAQK